MMVVEIFLDVFVNESDTDNIYSFDAIFYGGSIN